MQLDVKLVNKILSNIEVPTSSETGLIRLNVNKSHTGITNTYGSEGEYNETEYYYSHKELPENTFLRVTKRTDSYGDNEFTLSIQFVEGKAKQVTIFEPI